MIGEVVVKFIDFLRNRLKLVIWLCFLVLAALAGYDILIVDKHHAHTWVEQHIPAWWSIFGLFACVVIILVSKWFGHCHWFGGKFTIMAPEDYYDR